MSAGIYNFTNTDEAQDAIEQGAAWSMGLFYGSDAVTPQPMAGWTARMQIRGSVGSKTVLCELTTANSRITLGAADGSILLSLSAVTTAALSFQTGVYDLELVPPSGAVIRLLKGDVELSKEVTR